VRHRRRDLFALPKAVVQHSSGTSVLLRPPDPLSVEKLKLRSFVEALDRYRSLYEQRDRRYAVLILDELNLDLLEAATRILLVVTPEMARCTILRVSSGSPSGCAIRTSSHCAQPRQQRHRRRRTAAHAGIPWGAVWSARAA